MKLQTQRVTALTKFGVVTARSPHNQTNNLLHTDTTNLKENAQRKESIAIRLPCHPERNVSYLVLKHP